jgi:hypothetical protein
MQGLLAAGEAASLRSGAAVVAALWEQGVLGGYSSGTGLEVGVVELQKSCC